MAAEFYPSLQTLRAAELKAGQILPSMLLAVSSHETAIVFAPLQQSPRSFPKRVRTLDQWPTKPEFHGRGAMTFVPPRSLRAPPLMAEATCLLFRSTFVCLSTVEKISKRKE